MTDIVGKGPKTLLKIVKVMKEDGSIAEVKYKREEIEESLINQNVNHYKKVLKTLAY